MEPSYESDTDEETPLVSTPGNSLKTHDTRQAYEKKLAVFLILISILFERIAYYSLLQNLAPTLLSNSTLAWHANHVKTASFIFSGTRCLAALIFAAVCDARSGRKLTILIGFIFYAIGYILIIVNTNVSSTSCKRPSHEHSASEYSMSDEGCLSWVLISIICTALAAGNVQVNMSVFGAEQIRGLRAISHYADKYVIAVNVGESLALTIIPFAHLQVEAQEKAFFYVYLSSAIALFTSIILFLIACRYCFPTVPYDSVLTKLFPVIINAFQSWRIHKQTNSLGLNNNPIMYSSFGRATSYSYNGGEHLPVADDQPANFLDHAKLVYNGKFQERIVDDVNALRRGLIVFTLLISYWVAYNQISSSFRRQALTMKNPNEDIPTDWITLADPITIIIGIVIQHLFFKKYLKKCNKEKLVVNKFIIGFCFAALAMITAGVVEIFRQKSCTSLDCNSSKLDVHVTIPQNILIGLSELFSMVASYEFAYFAAPRSGQSLFMSLRFAAAGVAVFIDLLYSHWFLKYETDGSKWTCTDIAQAWRFYTYFFILAGLQIIFIITFFICYKKTRLFKLNSQQLETNQLLLDDSLPSDMHRSSETESVASSLPHLEDENKQEVGHKRLAAYIIFASIFFERLVYYSLMNNISNTLTNNQTFNWTSTHMSNVSYIFYAERYITMLVFSALCDAKIGRRNTIIIGFVLYLIGHISIIIILAPSKSIDFVDCTPWFLTAFSIIVIGSGIVQVNLSVFVLDQIQDSKFITHFANIYMILLNIAYLFALIPPNCLPQYHKYYYIVYAANLAVLLISILLFALACRYAVHVQPYDTVVTKCVPVLINAFQSWYDHRRYNRLVRSRSNESSNEIEHSPIRFLDFAKVMNHGKFQDRFVNDVKTLWSTIIVFCLILPYSLLYNQENTTFPEQRNRTFKVEDSDSFNWMPIPDPLIVVVSILILEIFVYKYFDAWNKELILVIKLIIGMFFAMLAMLAAATTEIIYWKISRTSLDFKYQLFQIAFLAVSEVFVAVSSYEFAYYASPRSAQSLFMAFYFIKVGCAQFIDLEIQKLLFKYKTNDTYYYIYFFSLAGFQLIFILIFILCYRKYHIIKLNPEQVRPTQTAIQTPTVVNDN